MSIHTLCFIDIHTIFSQFFSQFFQDVLAKFVQVRTNLETEINNGRFSILVYKNDGKGDTIMAMAEVGFKKSARSVQLF